MYAVPGSACGLRPAASWLLGDLLGDLDVEVRVDVSERRAGGASGTLVFRCAQEERELAASRLQVPDPLGGERVDADRVDAGEAREDRQALEDDLRAEVNVLERRRPLQLRRRVELEREHEVD